MSNSYSEKAHPSSIYTRFNTRYVIHLYTDTLFQWSQMKINKTLNFPYSGSTSGTKHFLCLKQLYCCLTFVCVYVYWWWIYWISSEIQVILVYSAIERIYFTIWVNNPWHYYQFGKLNSSFFYISKQSPQNAITSERQALTIREKGKRSESVLWQKPLYQQKILKKQSD